MHSPDHTDIILKALAQDIAQMQEKIQVQDMLIMQILETLAAVGIISFEEPEDSEEESSKSPIIEP
jgi:hypothetical protein